jgi:hypothetical protein
LACALSQKQAALPSAETGRRQRLDQGRAHLPGPALRVEHWDPRGDQAQQGGFRTGPARRLDSPSSTSIGATRLVEEPSPPFTAALSVPSLPSPRDVPVGGDPVRTVTSARLVPGAAGSACAQWPGSVPTTGTQCTSCSHRRQLSKNRASSRSKSPFVVSSWIRRCLAARTVGLSPGKPAA